MKLDSKYSVPDLFRLAWSLLLTKIFFREARIIRQPSRIRGYSNMKVGKGFTTGHYCRIEAGNNRHDEHSPTLIIGNNVQINDRCHIAAISKVIIGENVLIASDVFITDHDHGGIDYSSLSKAPAKRELVSSPVVIEDNVWLCEKVIILKGVRVGHNSIVAAGAVVTKDIPPFSIAVGIPARVTRLVHEEHDHFNKTVS